MEWVETTGSTVEEARERALDQLGVDQQEAEFEIVTEPRTGLFGRVKEEARVRARVRPKAPPAKAENRDRRRGKKASGRKGRGGSGSGGQGRGRGQETAAGSDRSDGRTGASQGAGGGRRRDGKGSSGRSRGRGQRSGDMNDDARDEEMPIEEQKALLQEFFENLVDEFGFDGATVTTAELEDDVLEVSVQGSEVGYLIGPRATTLNALEEIARTIVQRHADHRRYARIRVDVGRYRERRTEALEEFARKMAEAVLETGEEHIAEPMSSADRKVIHDVIVEIDGVETRSVGEDPRRRVVVAPAS